MSSDPYSPDNVLVVTFGETPESDQNAYQALTDLKQLDSQGQIQIAGAAVVTRDRDGRVDVKSEVGNDPYVGIASGGMIGLLVGIIGGPLGLLLGGTYGALVGSLFDMDEAETTESVLAEISKQVRPSRTAVLAQVVEQGLDLAVHRARLLGHVVGGGLDLAHVVGGVDVGLLARLARVTLRLAGQPARLLVGLLLDLGRALLCGLDDGADLVGRRPGHRPDVAGRPARGPAQLADRVRDLAQVAIDFVRVIPAPGGGEVLALDGMAIQLHGRLSSLLGVRARLA